MTAVDWSRWRKCPVCGAETRDPCLNLSGFIGQAGVIGISRSEPHRSRKPRTGGA